MSILGKGQRERSEQIWRESLPLPGEVGEERSPTGTGHSIQYTRCEPLRLEPGRKDSMRDTSTDVLLHERAAQGNARDQRSACSSRLLQGPLSF